MYDQLEDHGLPLVQLKEQRRDLVVALRGRTGPLSTRQISEIAALQQTIAAAEAIMLDLDAESGTYSKERTRSGWRLIEGGVGDARRHRARTPPRKQ